jgi:hypothetical protein
MDWLKLPVERLFGFLTALIPGAALLLVCHLRLPQLAAAVIKAPELTYHTKMAMIILSMFAAGWTAATALRAVLGGALTVAFGMVKLPQTETPVSNPQPWHKANWRAAYLGSAAPENVSPIYQPTHELQLKGAETYSEPMQSQAIFELGQKKFAADLNDYHWSDWYRHFHLKALTSFDPLQQMTDALALNLQAASLVVLLAMPSTPVLRRWWLVAGSVFWLFILFAQATTVVRNYRDPWMSFVKQIEFLQQRLEKGEHFTARK